MLLSFGLIIILQFDLPSVLLSVAHARMKYLKHGGGGDDTLRLTRLHSHQRLVFADMILLE